MHSKQVRAQTEISVCALLMRLIIQYNTTVPP